MDQHTLNAVYAPDEGPQFSVQYGGRLIARNDAIGGSSYTDLLSLEIQPGVLHQAGTSLRTAAHAWDADAVDYSAAASVGMRLLRNVWIAARYTPTWVQRSGFLRHRL